jgi:hypothetical protein
LLFGAEQDWIGEEWNDLSRILLSLSGIRPPLISRGRLGTWQFGGMSLLSTCIGFQEGPAVALCGPWQCHGAKEALGIIDCSVLTLCVSGCAGLDRLPPRCTFWRLLGGEGGRVEGLTCGLGSPRAPRGHRGVCLLVSHFVRDPVEGAIDSVALAGRRLGAPEP